MNEMLLLGRGGEGVVVASQLLAETLARAGFWVQSFPEFTAERRGAPIAAELRPMGNVALLGACVKLIAPDALSCLEHAVSARMGAAAAANIAAARAATHRSAGGAHSRPTREGASRRGDGRRLAAGAQGHVRAAQHRRARIEPPTGAAADVPMP